LVFGIFAVLFSVLVLSSCNKCPIFSKFFCSGKSAVSSASLQITDIRIGTGEKDISTGTIVFTRVDNIIITFDVNNFTTLAGSRPDDKSGAYYWLRQDIIVRDKNGGVVMLKPSIIDRNEPLYSKPLKFKNSFTLSNIRDVKPGKYTVSLLVTDLIGFQTATSNIPIKIK